MPDTPRTRCPMCGEDFDLGSGAGIDLLPDTFKCPNCNWTIEKDSLIGEDDDCAWDY